MPLAPQPELLPLTPPSCRTPSPVSHARHGRRLHPSAQARRSSSEVTSRASNPSSPSPIATSSSGRPHPPPSHSSPSPAPPMPPSHLQQSKLLNRDRPSFFTARLFSGLSASPRLHTKPSSSHSPRRFLPFLLRRAPPFPPRLLAKAPLPPSAALAKLQSGTEVLRSRLLWLLLSLPPPRLSGSPSSQLRRALT